MSTRQPVEADLDWQRHWFYPQTVEGSTDLLTWGILVAHWGHYSCSACNLRYPYCIPKVCCGLHQDYGTSHPVHAARGLVCVCPDPPPEGRLL